MKRTLVISDIHGELEKFEQLLRQVEYNPENDQLILLGDYIDRGPNAKGVIAKVISLQKAGAQVLKGNHEDMMVKALTSDVEKSWNHWVKLGGGDKTLFSYGFSENDFTVNAENFRKPILQSAVLQQHLEFVQGLKNYIETPDYIFVHAGVHPTSSLSETNPHILLWIRDEFHKSYAGEKTVIFGHTETSLLHEEKENYNVYFGDNRIIGIDGGAVYGGQLNCLELPSQKVYSVK
ncbi:metallophosphoesterase family protein [Psychrobacillus lasiicapitis]|uniref:Serine/threonine protein phosphatase n=1 Tax=Psychrobacillus lasiicapitis TaxID=1636719 RepID=A0A544TH22_9BACI|nr:metallophosphoesterase family protein [Psychrobacillus lasiicapitis]TQR16759.1 serine/threonine protein phosphatase [Psychrobacillus lasiicapitis]GGA27449.1 serine/threonine protein phosphatase [Psychrobacillus lasiicapitis]